MLSKEGYKAKLEGYDSNRTLTEKEMVVLKRIASSNMLLSLFYGHYTAQMDIVQEFTEEDLGVPMDKAKKYGHMVFMADKFKEDCRDNGWFHADATPADFYFFVDDWANDTKLYIGNNNDHESVPLITYLGLEDAVNG